MKEGENIFAKSNSDIDWLSYNSAEYEAKLIKEKEEKFQDFKKRIAKFDDIVTLDEAKTLAKQILPTAEGFSQFKIGIGTCYVVNQPDMLRISLDSDQEFICYDFV